MSFLSTISLLTGKKFKFLFLLDMFSGSWIEIKKTLIVKIVIRDKKKKKRIYILSSEIEDLSFFFASD